MRLASGNGKSDYGVLIFVIKMLSNHVRSDLIRCQIQNKYVDIYME